MWTIFALAVIALAIIGAFAYQSRSIGLPRWFTHGGNLGTVSPEWLAEHRNHR